MAKNISAKLQFLDAELTGLRARMAGGCNAVQLQKLEMLSDIRDDYQSAADRAAEEKRGAA